MPIRREDKEFIQSLSLLGAILGACLGVIFVMHQSRSAHQEFEAVTEYHQTHAALLKLSQTVVNPNNPITDDNVMHQLQEQFEQTPQPDGPAKKGFWVELPQWGFIGLCMSGCILGAVGGYSTVMATGWIGTVIILYVIRLIYLCIRKTAPQYAASIHLQSKSQTNSQQKTSPIERDNSRILPTLVKLTFFIALVLMILGAVVWHITAM